MNWITEKTTASEVVNTCGASISETIKAVEYWHELKMMQVIDLVALEALKAESLQDWTRLIEKIKSLNS